MPSLPPLTLRLTFLLALLLRLILLLYGHLQDTYTPIKYTDIDYYVFTDAARFIHQSLSPYTRETYRYTPLLAYLLLPTAWSPILFPFGKLVFALSDLLAGWLLFVVLRDHCRMSEARAVRYAAIWLLNPMVAAISTRGSSEGLLAVMVTAVLWAVLAGRWTLGGALCGLAVHFKIYPFIYGAAVVWWADERRVGTAKRLETGRQVTALEMVRAFVNPPRLKFTLAALGTFGALNGLMYHLYVSFLVHVDVMVYGSYCGLQRYGDDFLSQTFLHHLTRLDHRHNFSIYNTLLHLSSARPTALTLRLSSLAFVPQLLLALVLIPLVLAKRDLSGTMLAQTFAFVAFNKVCTSQVSVPVVSIIEVPPTSCRG